MAYTTVFSASNLFQANTEFNDSHNRVQTKIKTLTRDSNTQKIPASNVTIQSINFDLKGMVFQTHGAVTDELTEDDEYFFLTNAILTEPSGKIAFTVPSGNIQYLGPVESSYTVERNNGGTSQNNKIKAWYGVRSFSPFFGDEGKDQYVQRDILSIPGSLDNSGSFQNTDSIPICLVSRMGSDFSRMKYSNSPNYGTWTCTVTWDYTNTKCSPPTAISLDSSVVGKKQTTTLNWSGAKAGRADNVNNGNTIKGYKIFRNGNHLTTVYTTSSYGSTIVEAPETNGTTYTYTIQTIGSLSNTNFEYSNTSTASATLKASWTDIKISSFKCKGKTGPLYVGASGTTLDFSWSATGGTNNAVSKYILKRGSDTITTITDPTITSYTLSSSSSLYKTGTYTLEAVGTSASTISSGISITVITGKSSLKISGLTSKTIKQDTIQINIETLIPANYNCSEIQYNLGYKQSNKPADNFYTNFIKTWQNTITLTDKIPRGENFKLYVRVRYMGIHGGSTYKNYAIIDSLEDEYIIIDEHNPAEIESVKDKNSNRIYSDGKGYGYGTIELTCKPASQKMSEEIAISGKISSYTLIATDSDTGKQLIKKTISISPGEGEETDTVEMSLASIADGTKLNVQIQSIDEYGLTNLSNLITTVKFKLPEITAASNTLTTATVVDENDKKIKTNNLTSTAKIIPYVMAETELGNINNVRCSMELKALGESKSFPLNPQQPDNNGTISKTLADLQCKSGETGLQGALYTEVITNQNPTPPGVIIIKAWYDGYDSYKSEASINFNFDYFTPLSDIQYTLLGLSGNSDIGYYLNPFASLTVNVAENEWHNAVGEPNEGASITTALYQGTTLLQDNTYKYAAYNPSDITKTFKIRQVLSYSGTEQTLIKEKEFNVILAKWNNKETVKIKSVSYIENSQGDPQGLSVSLLIPIGNLGSATYKNGNELVSYSIYDKSDTENELTSETFTHALDSNTTEVIFNTPSITNLGHNTRTLYATLTFTNTSEGTITLTTTEYLLSVADVTLAMRKNKIGINVEKSYGVKTNDLKERSILQINGLTGLANTTPIVHVSSPDTPSSATPIHLMRLSTQEFESVFSTDGTNLFISNLDINSLTGTLNISHGGTGATNAAGARANLGAFASTGGEITGVLTITTSAVSKIIFKEEQDSIKIQTGFIHYNATNEVWSFVSTHSCNSGGRHNEYFHFPAPDKTITTTKTYSLLSTRNAVTIRQGGTGASDAATARANLEITPANIDAVPITRTVNGKALSQNIILAAADVSAVPTNRTVNGKALSGNITLTASDVGIFYATSLPAFSAADQGKICLVKKG